MPPSVPTLSLLYLRRAWSNISKRNEHGAKETVAIWQDGSMHILYDIFKGSNISVFELGEVSFDVIVEINLVIDLNAGSPPQINMTYLHIREFRLVRIPSRHSVIPIPTNQEPPL